MGLSKKAIETLSVDAVRDAIMTTKHLDQYIPDNDKEPFWDGAIYIYNNEKHTKENFVGRMPVQVKGCQEECSKEEISFPISTIDLRGYLVDGGLIYFVVFINNSGTEKKIYYVELTPIKIRIILEDAKGQASKSVKLKIFPNDNSKKSTIFFNCLQNCNKQASFAEAPLLTLEELKKQDLLEKITIPFSGVGLKKDFQTALVNNDVYIYANIKGCTIPQPIKCLPTNMKTFEDMTAIVTVAGKKYYEKIRIIKSRENTEYLFGSSFSLIVNQEETGAKISYKNSDDIRILSTDLDFMLSYMDNGCFELNGEKFPFKNSGLDTSKFDIEHQREVLEFARKATCVLDMFSCRKKLSMKSIDDESVRNINRLYESLIENKIVSGLKKDLPYVALMKVGNLSFIVVLTPSKDNDTCYKIENFFDVELVATYEGENGERLPMSQYVILTAEDIEKIDNIKWDQILPSFKNIEKHREKFSRANYFLLELIKAYDKTKNKEILPIAKDFAEWIMTSTEEEMPLQIKKLNLLQVVKRMRKFREEEIKDLYKILEDKNASFSVLMGAHILLDQQIPAKMLFDKMDTEEQNEFVKYPIYKLLKNK